jgi:hypothetical protein
LAEGAFYTALGVAWCLVGFAIHRKGTLGEVYGGRRGVPYWTGLSVTAGIVFCIIGVLKLANAF